jgi:hypothetical protein
MDKLEPETRVRLNLSGCSNEDRAGYLSEKTGVSFVYKVYGVVKSKNPDGTYNVEWKNIIPQNQ